MMRTKHRSVYLMLYLGGLLLMAQMSLFQRAVAQPDRDSAAVVFVLRPGVQADVGGAVVTRLIDRLAARGVMAEEGRSAESRNHAAVLVELVSRAQDCCASPFSFALHIHPRPPRESLFSPAFEAAHLTLSLEAAPAPARLDFAADLLVALVGYSQDACDLPLLATLGANAPAHDLPAAPLDYVTARCLYAARDYAAATALLEAGWTDLPASSALAVIWQAAIAQNLAQSFQFDAALALDDDLIAPLEARMPSLEAGDSALLAELYLLRGQHRLYLYEWDAILEDYNAALALDPDHARAYYLRGLLHMTQNAPEAALQDLRRFLDLEHAHPVPEAHPAILAQAEAYHAELETLLSTPQAD